MSSPDHPPEPIPIAHVRFETSIPSPDAGPWWRRKPSPQVIAIGTAGALAFAILLGLLLTPAIRNRPAPAPKAAAAAVTPASLAERFTFPPAREPYRAPDINQVERAYADVQKVFKAGGVSQLAREGLNCFHELERAPGYAKMDYCLAFDMFAQSENARLIGGEMPSATSWFGSVGARDLNVAQSIMAVQGDADARLLDLRGMASKVSSRSGGPPLLENAAPPSTGVATSQQAVASAPGEPGQLAIEVVEPVQPAAAPMPAVLPTRPAAPARRATPALPAEALPQPVIERVVEEAPRPAAPAAAPPAPTVQAEPVELPPPQ